MIEYSFGERKCKLDWNIFIYLLSDKKYYKSDFKDFSDLYEYIDRNKKGISQILLDGHKYILENGVLHNLYGPAYIRYNDKNTPLVGEKSNFFYIDGKAVSNKLDNRGCRTLEEFGSDELYHYKEISNKKHVKDNNRKEGVDYIKTPINIKQKILLDQRKKKLDQISNGSII